MRDYVRRRLASLRSGETGFTLVELLVVVGIIVALAAVIIPNVASFADKGDEGAKAAEQDNVQTAMDTMMADQGITAVDALTSPATSSNVWTDKPTGTGTAFLQGGTTSYLRNATTTYFYCYDSSGLINQQDDLSAVCP